MDLTAPVSDGAAATMLDWLSALGTVGALLVAVCFGIVAERRTRADRKTHDVTVKEQLQAAQRHQAERVAIWATEDLARPDANGLPEITLHVANVSDLPVFEVVVPGHDVWPGWMVQALKPGEEKSRVVTFAEAEAAGGLNPAEPITPDTPALRVVFRDNAGRRWVRFFTGHLLALDP